MRFALLISTFLLSATAQDAGHLIPIRDNCGEHYEVKEGDICFSIAARYALDVDSLQFLNPTADCKKLYIGSKLCVSGGNLLPNCTKKYYAVANDSCFTIAAAEGLTLAQFYALNPKLSCDNLRIDQLICLATGEPPKKTEVGILPAQPDAAKESSILAATSTVAAPPTEAAPATTQDVKPAANNEAPPTKAADPPAPKETPKETPRSQPQQPAPQQPAPQQPQPQAQQPQQAQPSGNEAVDAHNAARAAAKTPPLSYDGGLQSSAQRVASGLASRGCALEHSGAAGVGENLYGFYGSGNPTVRDAVNAWVDEPQDGRFNHWTQVVWFATTKVGCGSANGRTSDGSNCVAIVCHYSPPGNVVGQNARG